jgi:hypothetical protein
LEKAQVFWYIPNTSTMLTYTDSDLPTSDFTKCDSTNKKHFKDGYTCFYRTINDYTKQCVFPYRIKDYYVSTFSNNKILCKIIPNDSEIEIETEITIAFNTYGTSGTNYSLVVTPISSNHYVGYDGNSKKAIPLELRISLYDYNNDLIKISDVTCSWYGPSHYTCNKNGVYEEKSYKCTISSKSNNKGGPGILKVAVEHTDDNGNLINLETLYAIPYSYYENN